MPRLLSVDPSHPPALVQNCLFCHDLGPQDPTGAPGMGYLAGALWLLGFYFRAAAGGQVYVGLYHDAACLKWLFSVMFVFLYP